MSSVSTLSDNARDDAIGTLADGLSASDVNAVWAALTTNERRRVLQMDDLGTRLPNLAARLAGVCERACVDKRTAAEARAASEGLRFCAQAPEAFAELGEHVRVYCSVRGAVHDEWSVEARTHWDLDDMSRHYRVRLVVKFDGKTVVRFTCTDLWSLEEHDECNVMFRYSGATDVRCEVRLPAGVPLSMHDWRVATRTYLRVATQYYAVDERDDTWHTTDEDAPPRRRKRTAARSSRRRARRPVRSDNSSSS